MGEVYRASDTKLKRQVAIKVLPASLGADAERLARFQREAEVLASLNHPHIAAIYGLEEAPAKAGAHVPSDVVRALVMELVEGEDLAQRLLSGPLPLDEALAIARQVADALEAAHEQGIIHRDLKPANIKVRPDGTVKVLDFGLAKLAVAGADLSSSPAHSISPTIASPVMTGAGMILGTAAYMSPEQARGKAVDARADIWAFGCVLYEMLTGRRPFDGDDPMSAIGAAIHKEPQWASLPATTPPAVKATIARCLQKDPKQRARHIGDVRLAIDGGFGSNEAPAQAVAAPRRSPWLPIAAAIAVSTMATALITWRASRPAPVDRAAVRFEVPPPAGSQFLNFFSLSPDGRRLAYVATDSGNATTIWIHSFESGESQQLPRTVGARSSLIWSPDGRSLAFATPNAFLRISVDGGAAQTLMPITSWAGGDWTAHDTILYGRVSSGLAKIPASGGSPEEVTRLDASRQETGHTNPALLPDDNHFLYFRASIAVAQSGIFLGALDKKPEEQSTTRLIASTEHAVYAAPRDGASVGHVLFLREGTLMAQRFDERTWSLAGEAVAIADAVGVGPPSYAHVSMSRSGVLAYLRQRGAPGGVPTWFDRAGRETGTLGNGSITAANFPRLSPDGKRVALVVDGDVWSYDVGERPPMRLTHIGSNSTGSPLWTPDGSAVVFEASSAGLAMVPSDGTTTTLKMLTGPGHYHPHDWWSNGADLLAARIEQGATASTTRTWDIVRVPMTTPTQTSDILASDSDEGLWGATLSPNKRFLAYVSSSTGAPEVWVRPFPGPGPAERVSPKGGTEPLWAASGREMIYLENDRFMSVKTTTDGAFTSSTPTPLFEVPIARSLQPPSYALAADGRLLVMKRPLAQPQPINLVLNWQDLPALREVSSK